MALKHVHSLTRTDWVKRWFWTRSQNKAFFEKQDRESHLTKPNLGIVCIQIAPMPRHIVILQCQQQIYRFKPTKSCKFTQNTTHFLPGNWKNSSCFMLRKLQSWKDNIMYIHKHVMWSGKNLLKTGKAGQEWNSIKSRFISVQKQLLACDQFSPLSISCQCNTNILHHFINI